MRPCPTEKHIEEERYKAETYEVGDKIYFKEEKRPYKIMARSKNFLVCAKPFNVRKTYLYCLVDLNQGVRGPDNYIFGGPLSYNDPEEATLAVEELEKGLLKVSSRRSAELNIVYRPPGKRNNESKRTNRRKTRAPEESIQNLQR